jgi:uncharacterized membrane protein
MRYFWTFLWSFLLSNMLVYVVSNMEGSHFDLMQSTILAVVFTVIISIMGSATAGEEA